MGKYFGKDGVGEGIVCECILGLTERFIFKSKGVLHANSKVRTLRLVSLALSWAWLLVFSIVPMAIILVIALARPSSYFVPPFHFSVELGNFAIAATDPLYRTAFWLSVRTAAVSTLICLPSVWAHPAPERGPSATSPGSGRPPQLADTLDLPRRAAWENGHGHCRWRTVVLTGPLGTSSAIAFYQVLKEVRLCLIHH